MATGVMIGGESGTGKSFSIRFMNPTTTSIINVNKKPLPFRERFPATIGTDSYSEIKMLLKRAQAKSIIIDDSQYLMANAYMRSTTTKFTKDGTFEFYKELGYNYWDLINEALQLPDDRVVYFLSHIDRDQEGNEKIKTIGKLLDDKICIEGMFTIVLKTVIQDGKFYFATVNNGHDTVKSPFGMFTNPLIQNNLKFVDDSIRSFYGIEINNITPAQPAKGAVNAGKPSLV